MDPIDMIFEEHDKLLRVIRDIYDDMLEMYQTLDGDQQRVFDMGEIFGTAKEALKWCRPAVAATQEDGGEDDER